MVPLKIPRLLSGLAVRLPLFNEMFAGALAKPLRWADAARRTPQIPVPLVRPFATALTAPVAPLVGPALQGRRRCCIDIHENKSPT